VDLGRVAGHLADDVAELGRRGDHDGTLAPCGCTTGGRFVLAPAGGEQHGKGEQKSG
jgi:hypothetical protein